ncbi:hypothetical protein ROHU_010283 [Labeo rohita]|uniref:Uncharacterized protein n=1 Tax=Labeo rohita TaxID=84645 RepID=A0A498LVB1_LABRO|nr:hypothetical protein ROHU_010283 [Labeo rohita]
MRARTTFVKREAEKRPQGQSQEKLMPIDGTGYPEETVEKHRKDYVDSLSGSSFHCLPPVKAEPDSRAHEQFMIPPALPTMTATSHVLEDSDKLTRMSTPKLYHNNDMSESMAEYHMKVHVFGNGPSLAVAIYGLRCAALYCETEFGADC